MKPVIAKKTHYTFMYMRDDGAVRTLRIRGFVLRFCIIMLCLLPIAGGAGIAVGTHYRYKAWQLADEARTAERELAVARLKLEQLSNVETIATTLGTVPPKTLNNELSAEGADSGKAPAAQSAPSDILAILNRPAGTPGPVGASNATVAAGRDAGALPAHNATLNAGAATSPATIPVSPAGGNATVRVDAPAIVEQPQTPLISDAKSPVRIINFLAQSPGRQRLRVRYDLISQDQQQVAGQVRYRLILRNGTRQDMEITSGESARFFSISRMKQMDGTARLPQGFDITQIHAVEVLITKEDGSAFHEEYPSGE